VRYQRTQIYLDPDEHRRLTAEAAARGISLAELMRQIVSSHVREQAAPYATKTWSSIAGVVDGERGEATDIERDEDLLKSAAWEARIAKKTGASAGSHAKRPKHN